MHSTAFDCLHVSIPMYLFIRTDIKKKDIVVLRWDNMRVGCGSDSVDLSILIVAGGRAQITHTHTHESMRDEIIVERRVLGVRCVPGAAVVVLIQLNDKIFLYLDGRRIKGVCCEYTRCRRRIAVSNYVRELCALSPCTIRRYARYETIIR